MAELLVKFSRRQSAKGAPNSPDNWYPGMVGTIKPDGFDWGKAQMGEDFLVLGLPDPVPPDTLDYLLEGVWGVPAKDISDVAKDPFFFTGLSGSIKELDPMPFVLVDLFADQPEYEAGMHKRRRRKVDLSAVLSVDQLAAVELLKPKVLERQDAYMALSKQIRVVQTVPRADRDAAFLAFDPIRIDLNTVDDDLAGIALGVTDRVIAISDKDILDTGEQ